MDSWIIMMSGVGRCVCYGMSYGVYYSVVTFISS